MARVGEDQMVFGVSPGGQGDGVPVVLLGIPRAAWKRMKDGNTSTFDLTKIGLPVRLIVYGAPDHATAMKQIERHNSALGVSTLDLRREDFAIKPRGEG